MRYLPHTETDMADMLGVIGCKGIESLYEPVPEVCRFGQPPALPEPVSEWDLRDYMGSLSEGRASSSSIHAFVGAGSYHHHIPAAVTHLISRSEFVTAYTPYQPEMSQGTLQGIYEYQTLVSRLLGMEVANASLYDGASSLAEALLMATRITGRQTVFLSKVIHPYYRRVVETYLRPTTCRLRHLEYLPDGRTDLAVLEDADDIAAVAIQSPNFFGCIEDLPYANRLIQERGAMSVTCFTEALAYGLYKNPGECESDIVCGEGQSLGIPQSYGGPGLGILAGRLKHVRSMPGRLVGKTVDAEGRRGFVLTLATREQHIRREKATSNICTNNNLCALTAAMYMASLGGKGFKELARLNYDKSEYAKRELRASGCCLPFSAQTFNEFVIRCPKRFKETYRELARQGFVAGIPLAPYFNELADHYLLCVTETKTKQSIDELIGRVVS